MGLPKHQLSVTVFERFLNEYGLDSNKLDFSEFLGTKGFENKHVWDTLDEVWGGFTVEPPQSRLLGRFSGDFSTNKGSNRANSIFPST